MLEPPEICIMSACAKCARYVLPAYLVDDGTKVGQLLQLLVGGRRRVCTHEITGVSHM